MYSSEYVIDPTNNYPLSFVQPLRNRISAQNYNRTLPMGIDTKINFYDPLTGRMGPQVDIPAYGVTQYGYSPLQIKQEEPKQDEKINELFNSDGSVKDDTTTKWYAATPENIQMLSLE